VGRRTCLDYEEKRTIFTLPGLELRPLARPVRSQSVYRLRYSSSYTGGGIVGSGVLYSARAKCLQRRVEFRIDRPRVPSEQLVERWALRGTLRRWRDDFECVMLNSGELRDHGG
jgi:hypothetical protein